MTLTRLFGNSEYLLNIKKFSALNLLFKKVIEINKDAITDTVIYANMPTYRICLKMPRAEYVGKNII